MQTTYFLIIITTLAALFVSARQEEADQGQPTDAGINQFDESFVARQFYVSVSV